MRNVIYSIVFSFVCFATLSAEECGTNHLIRDSGFDLWCGGSLCSWKLERGQLLEASSWHKGDLAVEMVGEDVSISQRSTKNANGCIRFEMLADIEETAKVTLSMDFFSDGEVEYSQELGRVRWEPLVYLVATPRDYNSVTFRLEKEGRGRVRIAQLEATVSFDCVDPPLEPQERPLGTYCEDGAQCESGICALLSRSNEQVLRFPVCSLCDGTNACAGELTCGVTDLHTLDIEPYLSCIDYGSRRTGTRCWEQNECASGVCEEGICSECRVNSDCSNGVCQGARGPVPAFEPKVCTGTEDGATCFTNSSCTSGTCSGGSEVFVCEGDGRECQEDSDCPLKMNGEQAGCMLVGVHEGLCE